MVTVGRSRIDQHGEILTEDESDVQSRVRPWRSEPGVFLEALEADGVRDVSHRDHLL
ncbi:hypothetical protein GCM10009672_21910 [Nesterenkonia lutea]